MSVQRNEAIVVAWRDDCESDEHYTKCVLSSMLNESRNPNDRDHTGPMTPKLARKWAKQEREASFDPDLSTTQRTLCAMAADTLEALASELHEVDPCEV